MDILIKCQYCGKLACTIHQEWNQAAPCVGMENDDYDHREDRKDISLDVLAEIKWRAAIQKEKLAGCGKLPCAGCDTDTHIAQMFRCYYCGRWFCPKCARKHFKGGK